MVNLLKDEERLKNERAKALKAKERFAQTASGFGSDGAMVDLIQLKIFFSRFLNKNCILKKKYLCAVS